MNYFKTTRSCPLALAAVLSLTLGACGGGGGGDTSKSVSRSGQVYTQQAESNALVCVDTQASGGCSANAATAVRSGADGSFQISFKAPDDAAAQRFLTAPLVAEISDGTLAYTLSAPAAKTDQINPLTTLVQRHIRRTGAALVEAEQAVAQQLGIQAGQIYQYQQQISKTADNARSAAALTQIGLALNAPMQVYAAGDTAETGTRLTSFNFKDVGNYDFYQYGTNGNANDAGQLRWDPSYAGLIDGGPRTLANARTVYEIRGTTGYSGREEYLRPRGNPARVQIPLHNSFTAAKPSVALGLKDDAALFEMQLEETDISNRPMADFVREMQSYEAKSSFPIEHSLFTLNADLLRSAVFPAGSRLYRTLRTKFAVTPEPAATSGSWTETESSGRSAHDLPDPAAMLAGHREPLRLHQSINGTAWDAMQKELSLSGHAR